MDLASNAQPDLTRLLQAWRAGDGAAYARLLDRVYDELKLMASRRVAQFGQEITLSATDLLHEALLRVTPDGVDFKNRAHFFATLSLSIRSLIVDHARARASQKRGGGQLRLTLTGTGYGEATDIIEVLAIEQALSMLEQLDPRCGQVVHLTYFAGLEQKDIAAILDVSVASVTRDLRFARDFIAKAIHDGP